MNIEQARAAMQTNENIIVVRKIKDFDIESKASNQPGNLLHNQDFLEQHYNDSNFDMYSNQGN